MDKFLMESFLPYGRHEIDEEDIAAVVSVLRSDRLTSGPQVEIFERSLQKKCNIAHAISCSSATAGLHIAALALELGPGSAVIVPSITFLATASAPHFSGAEIIFADVDSETGLLTPKTFLNAIQCHVGNPIKAVIVMHLAGRICDMQAIKTIADEYEIAIIEDACHALGASYFDKQKCHRFVGACSHSDVAVFSFHPVKTIAAGEGGAVLTANETLAKKFAILRSHGVTRDPSSWTEKKAGFDANGEANPWYYEMHSPAHNYRMSDINAALANSQLKKLSHFVARRAELAEHYDNLLAPLAPEILPPIRQSDVELGWHLYSVRIKFSSLDVPRKKVMEDLRSKSIGSQVHYIPLPLQPYWQRQGWNPKFFPGALSYYNHTLSLPLFPAMTRDDVVKVVDALKKSIFSG